MSNRNPEIYTSLEALEHEKRLRIATVNLWLASIALSFSVITFTLLMINLPKL